VEPVIEKVIAAEAEIAKLEAKERDIRAEAMADDGVIDDKEKVPLDRILAKIASAKAAVAKVRAQIAENKRIWDGKAGDLAALKSQVEALEAWGHKSAAAMRKSYDEVVAKAGETLWKTATAALAKAQTAMLKPYADYLAHSAAKNEYDPMRLDADGRLGVARASVLATKDVLAAIAKLDGSLSKLDALTAKKDYVAARDGLKAAVGDLGTLEARIEALTLEQTAYLAARAVLDQRLAEVSVCSNAILLPMVNDIAALTAKVDAAAAKFDFKGAEAQSDAMIPKVDILIAAKRQQDDAAQNLAAMATTIDPQVAAVLADTAPETAQKRADIATAKAAMDKAVADGDYITAIGHQDTVAGLVGGLGDLVAARAAYLARLTALDPRMTEYSVVLANHLYLADVVTRIGTEKGLAGDAVAALDYPAAMAALDEIEMACDMGDALVTQRKAAFDAAFAPLAPRIAAALACPYATMKLFSGELQGLSDKAVAQATAKDHDTASATLTELSDALDTFDVELEAYEVDLVGRIELRLAAVETDLAAIASPAPSLAASIPKRIVEIRGKAAARTDLEKLFTEVDLVEKMLAGLKQATAIITRLAGSAKSNEEAQKIVNELKASGKLFELPTEARNTLVETLMAGSPPTADDHKAIQDIWKERRYVDPVFDAMDKQTREKMIAKMNADPKVTQLKADWPKLSDAEKKQRVTDLTALVSGPDGWNTGMPSSVEVTKKKGDLGGYYPNSDKLEVNIGAGAMKLGFDEFIATIAHEMGHKYQKQLMDNIKPPTPTITPGDKEYDQARMLELEDVYWKTYSAEFDKIYFTSPSENHSRKVDDEVKKGLKDAREAAKAAAAKAAAKAAGT
jgi:hypothetical protein